MAAGLGFKTFTTGEVLTAADTNGYLMQGINVFASSAARAAAITSPQEGQYSYLKDTNALEYYDGAAWVGAPVGDITAVTAGKGLTGGGSSGDVTVSLATTAKGDLVAGSGASTAAVLAVGANNTVLTADSSTATGLKWAAAAGGSKVLQVVQDSSTVYSTTTSTSFVDTSLSATITPTASTSKILVLITQQGCGRNTSTAGSYMAMKLLRNSTDIMLISDVLAYTGTSVTMENYTVLAANYLDSPATTSAITYKTQMKSSSSGVTVVTNYYYAAAASNKSTMTLIEIGA